MAAAVGLLPGSAAGSSGGAGPGPPWAVTGCWPRVLLSRGFLLCRRGVCGRHAHDGQRQAVRASAGREPPSLRRRGSEVGARLSHYENEVFMQRVGELGAFQRGRGEWGFMEFGSHAEIRC